MPPAPVGFSLDESARRMGAFRWLEARYFEILGGWVPSTPEPAVKLLLARQSAHHGWHAQLLEQCLPSTKDHDPEAVTTAPSPGIATLLKAVAAAPATLARLVAVHQVLTPEKIAVYERHLDVANPVADGAVRRTLRIVLTDEVDHITEGLAAIEDLGDPDAAAEARAHFAALLADTGGLGD